MINARQIERTVRETADTGKAAALAMQLINDNNQTLNAAEPGTGTSILARALIAHGMIEVTSIWLTDLFPHLPLPEAFQAVRSLAANLPPDIRSDWINTETGERK